MGVGLRFQADGSVVSRQMERGLHTEQGGALPPPNFRGLHPTPQDNLIVQGERKLCWSATLQEQVNSFLMSPAMLAIREQALTSPDPVAIFENITHLVKPMLITSKPIFTDPYSHHGWFDSQCAAQKRLLAGTIKKLRLVDSPENFTIFI
ncbi:hypothetical protein JRQ81_006494 [Phrynocephalus forsythii]|uniref:Uncharacterized protein n=1 Tax=Phrynocephalus forsythii TaxID=171643 RepID=A0A9Q1AUE2_9SAUR|nr:hypothetical protein JRQ81_006494 [Phrynocephalus forsythii]